MSLRDKLTDFFYKPVESDKPNKDNTSSWTDIFFKDPNDEQKPQRGFFDFLYKDEPPSDESTISSNNSDTSLDNIQSKISIRESELSNLASFFRSVNPTEYPDSGTEYTAYLSLLEQLNKIKELLVLTTDDSINRMNRYQLEPAYKKFETDYKACIGSIQSLCYLSELKSYNTDMANLFSSHFTAQVEYKIDLSKKFVSSIAKKIAMFDKKYAERLSKELIEAEYRLTILHLMSEIKNSGTPSKNPFAKLPEAKKKAFEPFLSKDIRTTNNTYNVIADKKSKYIKYGNIRPEQFDSLDASASILSDELNLFSIDDFRLNELFDDGSGYNALIRFLQFRLDLSHIDSKTKMVDQKALDADYRATTGNRRPVYPTSNRRTPQSNRSYPDFEDDL